MSISRISSVLTHRLSLLLAVGAIHLTVAAAELEGTVVPIGDAVAEAPQSLQQSSPQSAARVSAAQPIEPHSAPQQPSSSPRPAPEPEFAPPAPVSPEQQWKTLDKELKHAFDKPSTERTFNMALLIPILGIVFIFGGPIVLLCYFIARHYKAKAERQQAINANIDKLLAAGRDIPVELLRGDEPLAGQDSGDLASGMRTLFIGIGLLIFLTALIGFNIGAVGFILIAIGCSKILVWYLTKPKAVALNSQQAGQQD